MTWNRSTANVVANACVAIVNGLVGFLTISFLTRQLGADKYGVWVLISLISGYLAVLDLGLVAATGRRLASKFAINCEDGVRRAVVTHIAASICLGLFISAAAVAAAFLFPRLFFVPVEMQQDAFNGVLLVGASLAIYFLTSAFNCLLWAKERFDVAAAVEIPIQITKAAAIFLTIDKDSTLATLAFITLPANAASGLLWMLACRWLGYLPRLKSSSCSWAEFRVNLTLGMQLFTHQFVRAVSYLSGASVIGNRLEPDDVTSYSLARFLTNYAHGFVIAVSQAAAARSVLLHSEGEHEKQRELLLTGGCYAFACSFLFLGGFVALGAPFIELWQGGRHNEVVSLLMVLAVGECMSMSQSVTNLVLVGMNRQSQLIKLTIVEINMTILFGVILAGKFGTIGVCFAIAFSSFCTRGLGQIWLACRALEVRWRHYLVRAVLPPLVPAVLATASAYAMRQAVTVNLWWELAFSSAAYGITFSAAFLLFVHRRQK
jgi:O-antigen/teichoic acid export membrane protein